MSYCFSCKRDTRDIKPKIVFTSNNRRRRASFCGNCKRKKSCLVLGKHQRGSGLVYNAKREVKHIGKFYRDIS